jgi:addiction module HigA family antidote
MNRIPTHPGKILKDELEVRALSGNRLALALRVPANRVTGILNGSRSITAETALRLAAYFGNDAQFWMNLQTQYDLAVTGEKLGLTIKNEVDAA